MNRLFRVLHRWKCSSATHKLALDALRHLGDDAEHWPGVFLWHVEPLLRGLDAPEAAFRDFTNHVLYPVESWGGAARLARKWYWKAVETLRTGDWNEASYAVGALIRYVTFAFSPPRTGHNDAALAMRAPLEWCVSRLYDELTAGQSPIRPVRVPEGDDWLERLVTSAAEESHCHLRTVASRFDFDAVIDDPNNLDDELKDVLTTVLTRAAATAGVVLRRAIDESGATPPSYPIAVAGVVATASLPVFAATRWTATAQHARTVRAMYREFRDTGRIDATLPEASVSVRDAYEVEVMKKAPRKPEPLPSKAPRSAPERQSGPSTIPLRPVAPPPARAKSPGLAAAQALTLSSPVASAPSIGAKHGSRLDAVGIHNVGDLIAADAEQLATTIHPHATAADVATWQDEAALCCDVPELAPVEAQLLVACGVTGPRDLAALTPVELWELVVPVAESPDGRRMLAGGRTPDLDAVTRWIEAAKNPRRAA